MRLITARVFSQRYFDKDCQPCLRTVRSWVEKGRVPGKIVEPNIYIDAEAWEQCSGHQLADKILRQTSLTEHAR